jgi:hypothetical protein
MQALLELKTRPIVRPLSWSLSMGQLWIYYCCGKKSFWALTQLQQEQSRVKKGLALFQILVTWVIISDWPRQDSWQHFYSRGLPTKELQATVPTPLSTSHTLQIFIQSCFVLQKNRCMRKELKSLSSRPNIRQNVVQTFRQFFPHRWQFSKWLH